MVDRALFLQGPGFESARESGAQGRRRRRQLFFAFLTGRCPTGKESIRSSPTLKMPKSQYLLEYLLDLVIQNAQVSVFARVFAELGNTCGFRQVFALEFPALQILEEILKYIL